jgi:acyl-CoA synthetase (NDP forming)
MSEQRSLDALFRPERVAVVGASERPGSPGAVLWRNLADFPGEVVPVSATAECIDDVPAYPSLREVPGTVDLALVAVRAEACPQVLRDAAASGIRCCVVVSAGFAEAGADGARLQDDMVRTAREGGVLLVGPNCLGVQNLALPLNASLSAGAPRGGTGISLVTQSGSYAMGVRALTEDEGFRFATAYSSGNRADLGDHEVVAHLGEDAATTVICLYLESVAAGRELLDAVRVATAKKPVVLAAAGSSAAGARAAASHTGALAADRRAWRSLLSSVGVTVAGSGLEMLDTGRVLAGQLPAGDRVAVITNSGGVGTELADELSAEGLTVPELSPVLQQQLAARLPAYAGTSNPVDLTPVWDRYAELYSSVLDLLVRSGEVDAVVPVLLHRSAEDPRVATGLAEAVVRLREEGLRVPVYVCWVAPRAAWGNTRSLHDVGIPCLEWPRRTARAVGHAARHGRFRREAPVIAPATPPRRLPPDVGRDAEATWAFLRRHGVPVATTLFCDTAIAAAAAARQLGFPVAVKVDHPSIVHKSDVGGVRVGLTSEADVLMAATELLALAPGSRVVVQRTEAGVEMLVGALDEPTFGPVVCFGAGGTLLEVIDDVEFAPAPLTSQQARALVDRPRAARLLDGLRGGPPADRQALRTLVRAVGDLIATYPEMAELDLNPVLAGPEGCLVVDARLLRGDREP